MLVELSVIPVGRGTHIADDIAEVVRIIQDSGLPFLLTPSATCLEGDWAEVMPVIRLCHERMRGRCAHVVTLIKIEDDAGAGNKLRENVASVQAKLQGG